MCNVQYVLLVDSNFIDKRIGLLIYDFFILQLSFIDEGVAFQKNIFGRLSGDFCLSRFLNLSFPVLCLFLIQRLPVFVLKTVFL